MVRKKKPKPRPLTAIEKEIKRRKTIVARNEKAIDAKRQAFEAEIVSMVKSNKNHIEIITALEAQLKNGT